MSVFSAWRAPPGVPRRQSCRRSAFFRGAAKSHRHSRKRRGLSTAPCGHGSVKRGGIERRHEWRRGTHECSSARRSGTDGYENAGKSGRGEKMGTARSVHASQKALLGTEKAVPIFSQALLFSRVRTLHAQSTSFSSQSLRRSASKHDCRCGTRRRAPRHRQDLRRRQEAARRHTRLDSQIVKQL